MASMGKEKRKKKSRKNTLIKVFHFSNIKFSFFFFYSCYLFFSDERTFQDDEIMFNGKCFSQHFFHFIFNLLLFSFLILCVYVSEYIYIYILLIGSETFNCSTENGENRFSKKNTLNGVFLLFSFIFFHSFFWLEVIVDTMNVMLSKANFIFLYTYFSYCSMVSVYDTICTRLRMMTMVG